MAIKTFTAGAVLTASDTNTFLANSGLVYVTSATIGSGVTTVNMLGSFTATYDNYRIVVSNATMSSNAYTTNVFIKMHDGTNPISTNYNFGVPRVDVGTGAVSSLFGSLQTTGCVIGTGTGDKFSTAFDVLNPFNTSYTVFGGLTVSASSNGYLGAGSGMHQTSAGYSAFQISVGAGTITGGTIAVYGYRKA